MPVPIGAQPQAGQSPNFQEIGYGEGVDYASSSPHLKHERLLDRLYTALDATIDSLVARDRPVEVLEIGAGHGAFTQRLRDRGARVTITEMSLPSVKHLTQLFGDDPEVEVVHDEEGTWAFGTSRTFDAVLCLSVLHHIPDYLSAVNRFVEITRPGGAFVSWEDPLWYSRLPKSQRLAAQAAYYSWRIGAVRIHTGRWLRGVATLSRRLRGVLDPSNPADMVEYHVVREGVDEEALRALLTGRYDSVALEPYWSTESVWWQSWGERRGYASSFGLVATGRVQDAVPPRSAAS